MRLFAVVLALAAVSCSRYDYTERAADGVRQPVRVDRLSGQTEVLTSNRGWVELQVKAQPTPVPSGVPCTADEIRQAHEPPSKYDGYLPQRIKERMAHCAATHP